jgi:hypothetical protein
MLIRVSGYNAGIQQYLEEGTKTGREYTRDELDKRVILDGDLDLTRMIYESLPDKGQSRYTTFTLAFGEDNIDPEILHNITQEFKEFAMYAYQGDEFNFYAEAHLPKIKLVKDKRTGDMIERKPHIHIVVPRKNLLSGNEANPLGMHDGNVKYLEAFQEYINQKYKLSSPREHVRADIKDAASVLSRYKGDDFYGKNREFKQSLVKQVIEQGIQSRAQFYALVGQHGETRVRNQGKPNEYIAVKIPGDAKYTNLKDTIFHDDFIVRRELKKAPLDEKIIMNRLLEWPVRAKEIKYVSKAGPNFRKLYGKSSPEERARLLAASEAKFYQTYGDHHDRVQPSQRQRDNQSGTAQASRRVPGRATDGLQNLSLSDVANHRQAGSTGSRDGPLLLPADAHLHLGQPQPGRDSGLRTSVPGGGRGRRGLQPGVGRRKRPATVSPDAAGKTTQGTSGGRARNPRNSRDARSRNVIPPYAKNPHRVATIQDIEQRARLLFDPLKRPAEKELVFKRASVKALTTHKQASTVAAYFTREAQQNQILPTHRQAIRRVDTQFYHLRRAVFSDERLTRQDKAQLVSVLVFERLKAREQIQSPQPNTEVSFMGSAAIRALIEEEKDTPGFTISGAKGSGPEGVRDRVKQIMDRLAKQIDPKASTERAKELKAKDLYTRKAKFSQNVHYLDKTSDKTLFVDTGKAISMRRGGITEPAVAVALQLAKERFGSTLTINGSADFKRLVVDAVAKNGLDIHFTDKSMNVSLAARRAELEIEKSGQSIAPATDLPRNVDDTTRASRDTSDRLGLTEPIEALHGEGQTAEQISVLLAPQLDKQVPEQERVSFVANVAKTLGIPDRDQAGGDQAFTQWQVQRVQTQAPQPPQAPEAAQASPAPAETAMPEATPNSAAPVQDDAQSPSELVRREAQWRQGMPISEADVRSSDTVMGLRAEDHVIWLVATPDNTPEATALLSSYMENTAYREAFKGALESLYSRAASSPEDIQVLDQATASVVKIVNQVERRLHEPSTAAPAPVQLPAKADPKVIQGELVAHGAAPYKHQEDKQPSYFVTLKTDAGERTVWGVGLEPAMQDKELAPGDQVRLQDHGTQPVVVQEVAEDGSVHEKTTRRREWSAVQVIPEREVAATTLQGLALATPSHGLAEQDQDGGMNTD